MPRRSKVLVVGVAGVVVVALAGCGTSSFKGASNSTTSTTASGSSNGSGTPSAGSSEAQKYADAATAGVAASGSGVTVTPTQARCYGNALVTSLGVDRLKAAGVTISDLRDSSKNLPARLATLSPPSARVALGAAVQKCGFGQLIGPVFAKGFVGSLGSTTKVQVGPSAQKCLADGFDAPPSSTVIADLILGVRPTPAPDADVLAGVILQCINLAPIYATQFGFPLSSAERLCINAKDRSSPEIRKVIAAEIAGNGGSVSAADQAALGKEFITCLTQAHIAALAARGG